jgi:hypothetical protein
MVQHTPRYVADDLLTLKYAAVAGTGVCWMPDYMCQDEMRERKLVRVLPDWAPAPAIVHAVFPSRRGLSPAVRRFLDYLGEAMPGTSVATMTAGERIPEPVGPTPAAPDVWPWARLLESATFPIQTCVDSPGSVCIEMSSRQRTASQRHIHPDSPTPSNTVEYVRRLGVRIPSGAL